MKDPLDRLLSAAAQAREPVADAEPPFGMETRVLAAWRTAMNEDPDDDWMAAFRPLIAVATGIMLLCIALNFATLAKLPERTTQTAELSVADAPIRLALRQ